VDELGSLVEKAKSGDLDAFGEIVSRFQDMAYGCAYAVLGDFHLAQDAAQEAFLQAYRSLAKLAEPKAFPRWFRKIVLRCCSRVTRRKSLPTASIEAVADVPSHARDPGTAAERREMKDAVIAAIRALPDNQRMVTTLYYINGYSQKDIAEFLEVPVTTVNNRLHASRKRLKERMTGMVEKTLKEHAPDERYLKYVIYWAITLKDEDRMIGNVRYWEYMGHHNSPYAFGTIQYELAPEYWHKGIGPEALRAAAEFGLTKLDFVRVQCSINAEDELRAKELEEAGFTREGLLRCWWFDKATRQWQDELMFSLIKSDLAK